MTRTPLEVAGIRWAGARARHEPSKHLHKIYVRERAKALKRDLRKAWKEKPMPLFEVR